MKKILSLLLFILVFQSAKSQSITITQPNGGEVLYACEVYSIKFTASGTSNYYNIDYSLNNGSTWTSSATNLLITNGQYGWTVPYASSTTCLLRVSDKNNAAIQDVSNNVFTIKIPVILTAPNGGEIWQGGTTKTITWNMEGTSQKFNIAYSTNSGTTWTNIVTNYTVTNGQYVWTVPNMAKTTTCMIRVMDYVTNCKVDVSDNVFTITPAQPILTYPNGDETFDWDQTVYIYWDATSFYSNVKLEYSLNGGLSWSTITSNATYTNGYYPWTVPQTISSKCLIRASNSLDLTSFDVSDTTFNIKRPLEFTAPLGGENWLGCNSYSIKLNKSPYTLGTVALQYSANNMSSWNTITTFNNTSTTSGTYSYSWTIPNTVTSNTVRLRGYNTSNGLMSDTTDVDFSISINKPITVTYPNGGESFRALTNQTITWSNTPEASGRFTVQYSKDNGTTWTTLVSNITGNSYVWSNIPNVPGTIYLVRVYDYNNSCKSDVSNANFAVTPAQPILTYPNGDEIFDWDQTVYIYWDATSFYSNVKLEYSLNGGLSWSTITSNATYTNGYYPWTVPQTISSKCLIRASNSLDLTSFDVSDTTFNIKRPLEFTAPVGGENWLGCNSYSIKLNKSPYTLGTVALQYSANNMSSWNTITTFNNTSTTSGTYSYSWTIPNTVTSNTVRLRGYNTSNGGMSDTTDVDFSISINKPITVTYPNGGESFRALTNQTITWSNTPEASGRFTVQYSKDNGTTWTTLVSNITGNSYVWSNIPNVPGTIYLVRVYDYNNSCKSDVSNANFTVTPAQPILTYPNGDETFDWDQTVYIYWDATSFYSNVKLEYSLNGGLSWSTITSNATYTNGYYPWTVPQTISSKCLIRASNSLDLTSFDVSDTTFNIKRPLEFTAPVGGENWLGCNSYSIKLNKSPYTLGTVALQYSANNMSSWNTITTFNNTSTTSGTYSYSWTIPNTVNSSTVRLRGYNTSNGLMSDTTDVDFSISINKPITVTYPNGGESFRALTNQTITWSNTPEASGRFTVQYSKDNGTTWTTLVSNITGNSYVWSNIPNVPGTIYLVRVYDYNNSCKSDVSNANFTVTPAQPILTYPNGDETFDWDQTVYIYWDATSFYSNVKLEYSLNGGLSWSTITSNATYTNGYYPWTVPQTISSKCLIRASNSLDLTSFDVSDTTFNIKRPLEFTAPIGGENWLGCNSYSIKLNKSPYTLGTVALQYSTNSMSSWNTITTFNNTSTTSGTYSYSWTIPNTVTSNTVRLRGYNTSNGGMSDTTDVDFSISINKPITVTYPNGGESFRALTNQTITWGNTPEASGRFTVQYSKDNGTTWTTLASNITGNSYVWSNIPNVPGTLYLVRVYDYNNSCKSDISNANFAVTPAQPILTYPNGDETFDWDQTVYIYWDATSFYSNVKLEYSLNGGASWSTITSNATYTNGYYPWTVPQTISSKCLIRASNSLDLTSFDVSDTTFNIKRPLEFTAPIGGENWLGCNSYSIKLNKSPYTLGTVALQYSTNSMSSWNTITTFNNTSTTSGTYSYSWTIPNTVTSNTVRLRGYNTSNGGMSDTTDVDFSISINKPITVTYPNGGESFRALTNQTITWSNTPEASGRFTVQYSKDNGTTWTTLASNITGNSYVWSNIPNVPGTIYLVRVYDYNNSCKSDVSNANFAVTPAQPILTSPNGGEVWWSGVTNYIYWDAASFYSNVKLEFSLDSGATWNIITTTATYTNGYYAWTIPQTSSTKCLIRASNSLNTSLYDISDAVFTIKPAITLLTPNGGDVLGACTQTSITFEKSPAYSNANVEYSLNGGTSWTSLLANYNYGTTNTTFTYNWSIPNLSSTNVKVRVYPTGNTALGDSSNTALTIKKAVTIVQPAYGGTMQVGTVYPIKWKSEGISNLYDIAYTTNGGTTWTNIATGYNTATSTYNWTIPNTVSNNCKIRVRDNVNSCKEDISATAFIISATPAPLKVIYPNGGETIQGCGLTNVTWTETGTPAGSYTLDYSVDAGATWITFAASYVTTMGSCPWYIPNFYNSSNVLMRVSATGSTTVRDISDATFTLSRLLPTTNNINLSNCTSVVYKSKTYTSSTTIRDTVKTATGLCDSVYNVVNITIQNGPIAQNINVSGCNSVVYNGKTYTSSTVVRDTLKSILGCDSIYKIANIAVNIITPITQLNSLQGCDSVVYNGITYTTSTIKRDTLKSYQGCDSIYKIATITIGQIVTSNQNINLQGCSKVVYNGNAYFNSTSFIDTIKTQQGCDSIYKSVSITIGTVTTNTQNIILNGCNSVMYNGNVYNNSTIIRDTLKTIDGCDSLYKNATIIINTITPITQTVNLFGCKNVVYNGTTYTSSIIKNDTIKSYQGCDSVYKIANITVQSITATTQSQSLFGCNSVLYNGITYTSSTQKLDTVRTSQGCDSIYKIANIVVNNITASTQTINLNGCNSVLYNGITYTSSTVVRDTLKTSMGCDSIYKITNMILSNPSKSYAFIIRDTVGFSGKSLEIVNTFNDSVEQQLTFPCSFDSLGGIAASHNGAKIFVTGSYSNTVSVLSTITNTVVATIPVGTRAYGIAVSPDDSKAFVTNTGNSSVSVINTATNSVVATIPVGNSPYGIAINPDGSKAFVTNHWDNSVSVINTSTNSVVATIPVGNKPYGICVSPDGSRVFVTNFDSKSVSVINTTTNTVVTTINVGFGPRGICIDPIGTKLFVANSGDYGLNGSISFIDVNTNSAIANVSVTGSPFGVSVTADGKKVYVGVGFVSGNKTIVIDPENNTVVNTLLFSGYSSYGVTSVGNFTATISNTFASTQTVNLSGCNSVLYNGITYTSSTIKRDTLKTNFGCDSVYKIANIKVQSITATTQSQSLFGCNSVVYNGITYTSSTIKRDTLKTSLGCDSVYKVANITIQSITATTQSQSLFGCSSVLYNGITYTSSTVVRDTIKTSMGCDSIYKIANITVQSVGATTQSQSLFGCNSVLYNGITYTSSTIKRDTLKTSFGCDSIYKIANITIQSITATTQSQSLFGCSSVVYNGITYASSTIKRDTLKTSSGCDSVYIVADITVTPTPMITSVSSNSPVFVGDTIKLLVTAINAITYNWQGVGGFVSNSQNAFIANAGFTNAGWYYTTVSNGSCSKTDSINVVVSNSSFSISGNLIYPNKKLINAATISLTGTTTATIQSSLGSYIFNGLATGNYAMKPSKNNDVKKNNGVSSIDVILVTNHILNKAKLNSPYKIIAADVNNNKTITNIDIIFMKRLILGIDTTFAGNRLWAFVDSAYKFPDTTNPFPYKDSISFTNLASNKTNHSFIGVKLGDVNYDWNPLVARGNKVSDLELIINNDKLRINNYELRIPVAVKNFKDLTALQYTLNFNNKDYEFVGIENNKLGIEFNEQQATRNGSISFLWTDAKGEEKSLEDGSEVFTLVLKGKRRVASSEWGINNLQLTINNSITEIEAWDKDNQQHNIILTKQTIQQEPQTPNTKQWVVSPNPNDGNIVVSLSSNTNKTIVFELSNAVGKTLYKQSVEAVKGSNSFHLNLNKNAKLPTGVYFIKAIGMEGENVKRIVVKD